MKEARVFGEETLLEKLRRVDRLLPLTALVLSLYGVLAVYSASHYTESLKFVYVQAAALLLGLCGMLALSVIDFQKYMKKLCVPLYGVSVLLLLLTLVFGTGDGNRSWIALPVLPFNIQPSEFVKLFFILTFSYHLHTVRGHINRPLTVLLLFLHGGSIMALVTLQGDLGSALVFLFVFLCMLFASGLSIFYFLGMLVLAVGASPLLFSLLSDYQRRRILVGFHPENDPYGYGYQVLCSKNAIQSGGLFGSGYLHGAVSQSGVASALPARQTDMILAVLGEELGFVGVLVYLLLLGFLLFRVFRAARRAEDGFGTYLCVGAGAVLIFQSLENIGMCLGVLPVIGLTLPFISYGGSSLLSLFLLLGAVLSVMRQQRVHKNKYK